MNYEMDHITHFLASSVGRNTIRKISEKYADIKPGDTVTMSHRIEAGHISCIEEHLTVCSVATGSLNDIVGAFGADNHGHGSGEELTALLEEIYGGKGRFMAISFC